MTKRGRLRWMILGVAIAAAAPYSGSLRSGFVYDDHVVIENAPLIHSLGGAIKLLTSDSWLGETGQPSGLYRPLSSLAFAVNWALTGPSPFAFHFVNVLLHAVACLLLFLALRRFGAGDPASFAAAILFAVHPLHSEAVVWIVGRAEMLAAILFLAAWAIHLRRSDADPRTGLAVGLIYLLAMAGKESAATLPIVLLAGDAVRRTSGMAPPEPGRGARWWLVRYGPSAAALAFFTAARWAAVGAWTPPAILDLINPLAGKPIIERLAGASSVIGRYILLMLWPVNLSADYSERSFDLPSSFAEAAAWVPAAAVALLLAAAFVIRRSRPVAALGLLFPAATFLFTSNVLFPIGTVMAERLAYLPLAGPCILAGWILGAMARPSSRLRTSRRVAAAALLTLAAAAGGARAWERTGVWTDDLTLWNETIRAVPDNWYARFNLAGILMRKGDDDGALAALRECIRIHPKSVEIHNEIGDILRRRGDLDGAGAEFRLELVVNRTSSRAAFNMGVVDLAQHKLGHAKRSFEAAVKFDPRNADAHYNLALVLMDRGDLAGARAHLEETRKIRPQDPDVIFNLGVIAARTGDIAGARRFFAAVLAAKPGHASALYNMGVLALEGGSPAEARGYLERSLAADPSAVDARLNLAVACLKIGDQACARAAAQSAAASGAALPPELAAIVR